VSIDLIRFPNSRQTAEGSVLKVEGEVVAELLEELGALSNRTVTQKQYVHKQLKAGQQLTDR
jgi:hypothetical protein